MTGLLIMWNFYCISFLPACVYYSAHFSLTRFKTFAINMTVRMMVRSATDIFIFYKEGSNHNMHTYYHNII